MPQPPDSLSSVPPSLPSTTRRMDSGAVYLAPVDDFVSPSQACVNPLFVGSNSSSNKNNSFDDHHPKETSSTTAATEKSNNNNNNNTVIVPRRRRARRPRGGGGIVVSSSVDVGGTDIESSSVAATVGVAAADSIGDTQSSFNPKASKATVVATAALADCLACSGCVTTAETVLLEREHGSKALRQALGLTGASSSASSPTTNAKAVVVLTLSPASWADLCRHWKVGGVANAEESIDSTTASSLLLAARFARVVHQLLGIAMVLDGTVPLQWSLQAAAQEFVQAYRHHHHHPQQQRLSLETGNNESDDDTMMQLDDNDDNDSPTTSRSMEDEYEQRLTPSVALNEHTTRYWMPPSSSSSTTMTSVDCAVGPARPRQSSGAHGLMLMSATCPAITCLAETSHHTAVPHLARAVSPLMAAAAAIRQVESQLPLSQPQNRMDNDSMNDDDHHNKNSNNNPTVASSASTESSVFHVACMPCHDKKLEASRPDFVSVHGQKYVDMVVTTTELLELLYEQFIVTGAGRKKNATGDSYTMDGTAAAIGVDDPLARYILQSPPAQTQTVASMAEMSLPSKDSGPTLCTTSTVRASPPVSTEAPPTRDPVFVYGSGGYADYIFRYAARRLFGVTDLPHSSLWRSASAAATATSATTKRKLVSARVGQQRRRDAYVATLYRQADGTYSIHSHSNATPVLRFGIAYGMQSVQRVLQSLQPGESGTGRYDYVEAMACPGSCLNGGGQLRLGTRMDKPTSSTVVLETPTETRQRVRASQGHMQMPTLALATPTTTTSVPPPLPQNMHTRYHVVPPMQHSLGAAAGVAVQDTQW